VEHLLSRCDLIGHISHRS